MKARIRNNIKEIIKSLCVLEEIKRNVGMINNKINRLKKLAESINSELNSTTTGTNNSISSNNRLESIKNSIRDMLDIIKNDVNDIRNNYTKNNIYELNIVVHHINKRIDMIISEI